MKYIPIFIGLLLINVLLSVLNKKNNWFDDENLTTYKQSKSNANYFEKKMLLSKAEYYFWRKLKTKCDENNILICPKVRMEDIVSVKCKDQKLRQRYRGYIKSRHIDFILCDKDLNIVAGIELDDSSHKNENVKKVDSLKDDVFTAVGVPLFRVKTTSKLYDNEIDNVIALITYQN